MARRRIPARTLDQFYTQPAVAARCLQWLLEVLDSPHAGAAARDRVWIEPSAGTGSFSDLLMARFEHVLALDLAPKADAIRKANFLTWRGPGRTHRREHGVVVGNPPFGKNASTALKFLQRATTFATTVAFIVPRTFQKTSIQRRIPPHFHLVREELLPLEAFVFDGRPYAVPCVFQIWQEQLLPRPLPLDGAGGLTHPDFCFTTKDHADFAFQRIGVRAGLVTRQFAHRAASSHYFLKATHDQTPSVEMLLSQISWEGIKHRTAGNPSISKRELVAAYITARANLTP